MSKGHATLTDVQEGRSALMDNIGNHISDKLVDQGVESINGPGLVRLGRWLAHRHDNYTKFMARAHRMIVALPAAEKEMRQSNDKARTDMLGI